jgi:hypothetical protein
MTEDRGRRIKQNKKVAGEYHATKQELTGPIQPGRMVCTPELRIIS